MTGQHAEPGADGRADSTGAPDVPDERGRLRVALVLSASVLAAEVVGAWWTGSLALLVDAGHAVTDVAGLGLALGAARAVLRPATDRRTWGLRRAEVLSATAQAAVLLAVGVYAVVEGVRRLVHPHLVDAGGLALLGAVGLVANVAALLVLRRGRRSTLNLRAAFLEVANDALGSMAVLVSALVIATTGWTRADAVAALIIAGLIVPRAVLVLREAVDVLLESAPPGLDLDTVRSHLLALPHVTGVHDLHATRIATGLPVLSAHVVVDDTCLEEGRTAELLDELQACVAGHFSVAVEHSTFQIEPAAHSGHEAATHR